LAKIAESLGEPQPRSGKQEFLENMLADYLRG
jgi:xylose isomerase